VFAFLSVIRRIRRQVCKAKVGAKNRSKEEDESNVETR
jgi:hypothetical protein